MCGDFEKKPEPYNFAGIAQAFFSQGQEIFGETRGINCTCISAYSVCIFYLLSLFLSDHLKT